MTPGARVDFDADGFRMDDGWIAWNELSEVVAFKEDLWSVDRICLGLLVHSSDRWVKLDEDAAGFRSFLAELARRLPGFDVERFRQLAFPAFERCETVLWRKPVG